VRAPLEKVRPRFSWASIASSSLGHFAQRQWLSRTVRSCDRSSGLSDEQRPGVIPIACFRATLVPFACSSLLPRDGPRVRVVRHAGPISYVACLCGFGRRDRSDLVAQALSSPLRHSTSLPVWRPAKGVLAALGSPRLFPATSLDLRLLRAEFDACAFRRHGE